MTDKPAPVKLCVTCALVIRQPGAGKSPVYICSRTDINAYTERQNPNGCGPDGKFWVARGS